MTLQFASGSENLLRLTRHGLVNFACRTGEACLAASGVPRPSVLLIVGHMRSGSTLLLHLLLTNPEISALGERNVPYASNEDLVRLAAATRLRRGRVWAPLRYVADQVNHDRFTPNLGIFSHIRVRSVYLLRAPQASLASLMELSRVYYGQSWTIARAVDYYVTRLQYMSASANRLIGSAQAAFLTYEQLTESPEQTLAALQQFLGLASGFSTQYESQPFTGRRGDPGPHLKQGRVGPTSRHEFYELPAADLERAEQAYVQCRQVLDQLSL